jgi:uncharacterized membrane protein
LQSSRISSRPGFRPTLIAAGKYLSTACASWSQAPDRRIGLFIAPTAVLCRTQSQKQAVTDMVARPREISASPDKPWWRPETIWRSFSGLGLILGAIFLAASLTPSLIPRTIPMQGAVAGLSFAAGYGIGVLAYAIWDYLELPIPSERTRARGTWLALAAAAVVVFSFIWRAAEWQNSIRDRMGMPPVEGARPLEVLLIAALVFAILILVARLFALVYRLGSRSVKRHVPVRVARVVGFTVAIAFFLMVGNGVLLRGALRMADNSFQALDALIEPQYAAPTDPLGAGGAESLIDWEDMGRAGREFVASGPTRDEISAFLGREALTPIRVYVGLNSAEDHPARAELALDELMRVGAFDREVLVVVVPTGTGWMDPEATDTLEYLHGGDSAIVAQQYSYLTSPISLFVEPGISIEAGRALFSAVYGYWTTLPRDARPRLYLYGLSLGAYGSAQSFGLHEVLADPPNGALWTGPPFSTPQWRAATEEREPGTPAWLPRFGDGSIIRFTNQENALDIPGATWGPMRIVFLQYASDPITFFDMDSFWRKPDWMKPPVGPDVSPELRWYPVVTFLQLMLDTAFGLAVPMGHGHLFAPEHYINAWVAVTAPEGWTPEEIARLKEHMRQ